MKIFSFDIFDTCLVRKCGTPENFFDVLSYRVFNGEVAEGDRQRFVMERWRAEYKACANDRATLQDIYDCFSFAHPMLYSKEKLVQVELECEKEMLVPVISVKNKIAELRGAGHHIIFISDMYLSSEFIKLLLVRYDMFKDGDSLYVSCEEGVLKSTGKLFELVREKERISYKNWTHYGDNAKSDVLMPGKLGIKAIKIYHDYKPYPKLWIRNDSSTGYKFSGIMAGLSRAMHCANEDNSHKSFVLDIIAPYYCSFVYKVLKDANARGLSRLFFCARDAYQMYRIAQRMAHLFPGIEIQYLYISRDALYKGDDSLKLKYFEQVGLTSKTGNCAIVDTTTSGLTLKYLNDLMVQNGYSKLFGYYFLLWDDKRKIEIEPECYHFEIMQAYIRDNSAYAPFLWHIWIFENFFGLNDQAKTVGYEMKEGKCVPVFSDSIGVEDCVQSDVSQWSKAHENLLGKYADGFIETELYRYSKEIFNYIALATITSFFSNPDKTYLEALLGFRRGNTDKPYVKKESLIRLYRNRGNDSGWSLGTMRYNVPKWLSELKHLLKRII